MVPIPDPFGSFYRDCEAEEVTDAKFLEVIQSRFPRFVRIGKVTGQVRLSGPAWDALRAFVWQREAGKCQDCPRKVILAKGEWQTMHAAHIKSKGSGGSDLPSNIRCLCLECHAREHSGEKVA